MHVTVPSDSVFLPYTLVSLYTSTVSSAFTAYKETKVILENSELELELENSSLYPSLLFFFVRKDLCRIEMYASLHIYERFSRNSLVVNKYKISYSYSDLSAWNIFMSKKS